MNKDRAERPYFEVVYYLSYKNGIQWLNYLNESFLKESHKNLLKTTLPTDIQKQIEKIYPYVKILSFKLREYNGLKPFENLSLEIVEAYFRKMEIILKIRLITTDKLIKYDRDFRKSFVRIEILTGNKIKAVLYKFGKKSGFSKFIIKENQLT